MPFIRPMIGPRFGRPGLLGTVARTAVIAGTATVTSRAISQAGNRRAAEKEAYAEQQQEQAAAYQQPAYQPPAYQPAAAEAPPQDAPAPGGADLVGQLTELATLKQSGALTEAEYESAKARLLG